MTPEKEKKKHTSLWKPSWVQGSSYLLEKHNEWL